MHKQFKHILILLLSLGVTLPIITSAQSAPDIFYNQTVGKVSQGSANYDCEAGQFKLTSSSASISGSEGSFQFVHRELTHDVDVKARLQNNNASLTGLMIRSGTGGNSAFAMVGVSSGKTITRYRVAANDNTTDGNSMNNASWIRIRRQGNSVSSYSSNDGSSWVLVETRSLDLGAKVNVGMVGVNGSSSFSDVAVIGTLENIEVVDPGPVDPGPVVTTPVVPVVPVIPDPVVPEPTVPTPVDPVTGDLPSIPLNLTSKVISSSAVTVYWQENTKNSTGFRIERKAGIGAFVQVAEVLAPTWTFADSGLNPSTSYTYRIYSFNQYGISGFSNLAFSTTFDGPVVVPEPIIPEPAVPEITDPGNTNSTPTAPVDETFSVNDIGTGNLGGTASYDSDNDMFSLSASGGQIWGTKDDFHYVYREVTGDVEATVKVSSLSAVDKLGKAGIMFRETSNDDSRHAFLTISSGKGVALERRHEMGGGTVRSGKGNISAPVWLRLIKEGTYVSAYYSVDGSNWSFLSEDIVDFPETIFIGLAVAANGEGDAVSADFGELKIVDLQSESSTETFISADIGKVGVNGDAAYDAATDTFIVEAAGGDIGHNQDAFHYVFREVVGDFETVTKIESLVAEQDWAKAGLMVRDSFRPNAPYFALFMAKNVGVVHQCRTVSGGNSTWSKVDNVATPFWVKITRQGNLYQGFYSMDGLNWIFMNEATMSLPQTLLIGMALTSHEEGALAYAEFSNLVVSN